MRPLVFGLLLGAFAASLHAQTEDIPEAGYTADECKSFFARLAPVLPETAREAALGDRRIVERTTPLGADGVAPVLRSEVALTASEDGGRAVVAVSGEGKDARGAVTEWTAKASAPFDKDQGEGTLLSDSGLSGDFVVGTSYSWTSWKLQPVDYGDVLCAECVAEGVNLKKCNETDLPAHRAATRWQHLPEQARAELTEEDEQRLLSELWGVSPLRLFGVEASAGRKDRSYFETDGTTASEDRIGYSAGVFGGVMLRNVWALYGKGSWRRDYKQQDAAELCTPVENSPLQTCKSQPLGRATEREFLVLSVQGIRFFRLPGSARSWALAPVLAYDFEESDWEVQLPAYLATNKDGDFTGGIKAVWTPDQEDEWSFGVFVSKPLEAWE